MVNGKIRVVNFFVFPPFFSLGLVFFIITAVFLADNIKYSITGKRCQVRKKNVVSYE